MKALKQHIIKINIKYMCLNSFIHISGVLARNLVIVGIQLTVCIRTLYIF